MKYWLHINNTPPNQILPLTIFAEALGFEGILMGDHWFMPSGSDSSDPDEKEVMPWTNVFPDIFVVAGMILGATKRIKFGSCVLVLPNRTNPFLVAKAASTAICMGGDRFVLGVGAGWMKEEFAVAGVDWETRTARMEEMIEVMRKLWGPGPVEHHGKFFDFPPTYAEPVPPQPVPVYIGGSAPEALRRAGRIGDGFMGKHASLAEIKKQIALVNEGRREAGREKMPFDFMMIPLSEDKSLPNTDDYHRLEEVGATSTLFGPIDWVIGDPRSSLDVKKFAVEEFAKKVMK